MIKLVFFGTPLFAVPSLTALACNPAFQVAAVVTQPDRPQGRSLEIAASSIARSAEALGLPILKADTLRDNPSLLRSVSSYQADLFVVVAYGVIIPKDFIDLPRYGALNIHPSLLPEYRGASPIQTVILEGKTQTGVTLMLLDQELDHGPILKQETAMITPDDTTETLSVRLAKAGAQMLTDAIPRYVKGEISPKPQIHEQATYTRQIAKQSGRINWASTSTEIARMVRAYTPWPSAWTTYTAGRQEGTLKIIRALPLMFTDPASSLGILPSDWENQPVGRLVKLQDGSGVVVCGKRSLLRLDTVQPAGKKPMSGSAFLNGYRQVEYFHPSSQG